MPKTTRAKTKASATASVDLDPPPWASWLTQVAFVLTLVLAIARAMMTETVRQGFDVAARSTAGPSGPGPTTTLLLNALCCLPALLVLGRRVADRTYVLRWHLSHLLLGLLAVWACASFFWSSDKFVTLISGSSTLASAVLVWSTAQLVRSWLRLRIVAGVCFGLLLIYIAQGLIYRFADYPDNVAFWNQNKEQILREHAWEPDSFSAKQFEKKLLSGEMIGFNQSPNSFAAVIVMLMCISAGVGIQRLASGDGPGWLVAILICFVPAAVVLYYTGTRTAAGTIFIAAIAMLALMSRRARAFLAARPALLYIAGVAAFALAVAALVGHGIAHGSLPQDSLNFRWRYWVAAFRMWQHHPLAGVGWGNFGPHYLAYRLPAAAEEIRDPHNFLVRAFSELGLVGGVLTLAWLARAAWELTRPVLPPAPATAAAAAPAEPRTSAAAPPHNSKRQSLDYAARKATVVSVVPLAAGTVALVGSIVVGGAALNALLAIDWSQNGAYLLLEVFRRVLAVGLLTVGLLVATARGRREQRLDDRPAPWLLWALLIALGVFFIHNLIDFVLAEPGPLTLFSVLLGAALGLRTPSAAGRRQHRGVAIGFLAAGAIAWCAALVGVLLPVADAEVQAAGGDDALRADHPADAQRLFRSAFQTVPYNADYAYRAARALMIAGEEPRTVLAMLDRAIAAEPTAGLYYLTRAEYLLRQPSPDVQAALADYERVLKLDPNNIDVRLEYAQVLESAGDRPAAAAQYRDAVRRNDLLHPDEPKRLAPERVRQIQDHFRQLESAAATQPNG